MDIGKVVYVLRSIGIGGILRTIGNSITRGQIERKFSRASEPQAEIYPGIIQQISPINNGFFIQFSHANVEIFFLSENMVRISWTPGKPPYPYTINKFDWAVQKPEVEQNSSGYKVQCGKLKLLISENGYLDFLDENQRLFRSDEAPFYCGESWNLTTRLRPEECIYGLGERAANLNLRPGDYCSWNTDVGGNYSTHADPLYIGTPVYLSLSESGSHLVYYENSYKSRYKLAENLDVTFEGGMLRYYIISGDLTTIYHELAELMGYPFLPPRWALGYHQCRWGYKSDSDIREVIQGFQEHHLPISAIHLDIDYMDGFRVFTNHPDRIPNLKRLTSDLDDMGIKVVATVNPAVKCDPHYHVYQEGRLNSHFCKLPNNKLVPGVSWPGKAVFPDFTNPSTRRWWADQYHFFVDAGISGIWHDMNEPSSFTAWGDITLPECTLHDLDGQKGDHREAHNLYGLLMVKSAFDGLRKLAPDKRPWIFSRSGWAGLQQYAWNWTGDIETSWEALNQTIPMLLGLSLSGHGFSGVDIGGFTGNPDAELYLRWFQMATFFPLFRTHSAIGTERREPWVYGEPTTSLVRTSLQLRYQLLPYFYTLAWDAACTGIPPLRPIFWENIYDSTLRDIDDEFLLGDNLLIAPVLAKGAIARKITLPAGEWFSFWDDQCYPGSTVLDYKIELQTIPLFVKAGAIIPLEEDGKLILHVYPGTNQSTSTHVYSDAGDGYGPWRLDTFNIIFSDRSLNVNWETEGAYPFPYTGITLELHTKQLIHATADGVPVPLHGKRIITGQFQNLELTIS